jgi:hypothetical protein
MLDSLSNLATEIGRTQDATELRARHTQTSDDLNKWLWNDTMGIYTNVRSKDSTLVLRFEMFRTVT